jgi:hypothetical protein
MPMTRRPALTVAVLTVAGLAGALLAVAVGAVPGAAGTTPRPAVALPGPVTWSAPTAPVPGAATSTTPALTYINFPARKADAVLFWTLPRAGGPGDQIWFSAAKDVSKDTWWPRGMVDRGVAITGQRPSAAPFGAASSGRVIVVWTGAGQARRVFYTVGTARRGGGMSWSAQAPIPGATSTDGPTVFTPLHSDLVFVAWRGAKTNNIDFVVGSPAPGSSRVRWGSPGVIPAALVTTSYVPPPQTNQSPAVAEVSTSGSAGLLQVLWTVPGAAGSVLRATTPDPVSIDPVWSTPVFVPGVATGAAPAASALGPGDSYPLVVAYRARQGTSLQYVTLGAGGATTPPFPIPRVTSTDGLAFAGAYIAVNERHPKRVVLAGSHICSRC